MQRYGTAAWINEDITKQATYQELKEKLSAESFDVIYDLNGRESSDTAPLADLFNGKVEHFIYMSSAGVYKKSPIMPHIEVSTLF